MVSNPFITQGLSLSPPETNTSHLKMDSSKTFTFPFWVRRPTFRGFSLAVTLKADISWGGWHWVRSSMSWYRFQWATPWIVSRYDAGPVFGIPNILQQLPSLNTNSSQFKIGLFDPKGDESSLPTIHFQVRILGFREGTFSPEEGDSWGWRLAILGTDTETP